MNNSLEKKKYSNEYRIKPAKHSKSRLIFSDSVVLFHGKSRTLFLELSPVKVTIRNLLNTQVLDKSKFGNV